MFFYRNPLKWVNSLEISASSAWDPEQMRFGYSISSDSNAELLGISIYPPSEERENVPNEFYLFSQQEGGQYVQQQVLRPSGLSIAESHNFGTDIAGPPVIYGANKAVIAVKGLGFEDRGAVAIFKSGSNGYVQEQILIDEDENTASTSTFGYQVVMSSDNSLLLVSNPGNDDEAAGAGKIYLYSDVGGTFQKVQELARPANSDVAFGVSQCVFAEDMSTLFVADIYYSTDGGTTRPGAVYVYESGSSGYQLVETITDVEAGFQMFGENISYNEQTKELATNNISEDWSGRKVKIFQSGSNGYQLSQTLGDATVSYNKAQFSYDGAKLFLNKSDNTVSVFVDSGSGYTEIEQISLPAGNHLFSEKTVNENGSRVIFGDYNDDTLATNAGAVLVYESGSNGWQQSQKILPTDDWDPSHDGFGFDINSPNGGETVFIAQNNYMTYGTWPDQYSKNTDSVGGSIYVFEKEGESFRQVQRIANPAPSSGKKAELTSYAALTSNAAGTRIVFADAGRDFSPENYSLAAPSDTHGAVYIFDSGSSGFSLTQEIASPIPPRDSSYDYFGISQTMNDVGTKLVVGAYHAINSTDWRGAAFVYESGSNGFQLSQELTASDPDGNPENDYFASVKMTHDGNTLFVGASGDEEGAIGNVGAVYVFVSGSSGYQQAQKIEMPQADEWAQFGWRMQLNEDSTIFAGAASNYDNDDGSVGRIHLYESGSSGWQEVQILTPPSDGIDANAFGYSMSFSGSYLAVGSYYDPRSAAENAIWTNRGAAYIYEKINGAYELKQRIAQEGNRNQITEDAQTYAFGMAVQLLPNNEVLITSPYDDKNGTDSGVVYKYKLTRDY